jgi:hypothetical protein
VSDCSRGGAPGDVDFTVGASLPISGLTAWQELFEHGCLQAGQSVVVHGAAGVPSGRANLFLLSAALLVVWREYNKTKTFEFSSLRTASTRIRRRLRHRESYQAYRDLAPGL